MTKIEKREMYSELAKVWRTPMSAYFARLSFAAAMFFVAVVLGTFLKTAALIALAALFWGLAVEQFHVKGQILKVIFFLSLYQRGWIRNYYPEHLSNGDVKLIFKLGKGAQGQLEENICVLHKDFWKYMKKYVSRQEREF